MKLDNKWDFHEDDRDFPALPKPVQIPVKRRKLVFELDNCQHEIWQSEILSLKDEKELDYLLTNGYDEDDFKELAPVKTSKFTIRHVGIVNEKCNPRPFMLALKEAMEDDEDLASSVVIDFVGEVHPQFIELVQNDLQLNAITTFTASVPHKQLITLYNKSSMLLLILEGYKDAEGYMPGKLFEYIATGLPILGVGPENGDASMLMQNSDRGKMIDGRRAESLKLFVKERFVEWKAGSHPLLNKVTSKNYSRRAVTEQLVGLL